MAVDDRSRVELARRIVSLIDLTDLADDHRADGIDDLCRRAALHHTAAVCVWPEHVAACVAALEGSGVKVATVVNFPSGGEELRDVIAQTRRALDDGADEIDAVLAYRALLGGDVGPSAEIVSTLADVVHGSGRARLLKVILETGVLGHPAVIRGAAELAVVNGADFIKTSTGKTKVSATLDAVSVMLDVIAEAATAGRAVGVKPSGGIRTLDDALGYLDAADQRMGAGWSTPATFRFGASGLLGDLVDVIQPT
jgi:deoxyribose-phosphate aldolase